MRKRINCALGWILLLLCPLTGFADQVSQSLLLGLAASKIKVARFEEQRMAFYLDQPLISRGTLRYRYPDSLEKVTDWPQPMRQSLEAGILRMQRKGSAERTLDVTEHPGLALLFKTILAILSGDGKALDSDYTVAGKKTGQAWTLMLRPQTEEARKWFKLIEVSGRGGQIGKLKVTEVNGDYTSTRLYDHSQR